MLSLAGVGSVEELKVELHNRLRNGVAFNKFKEFILAQGGDISVVEDVDKLPGAKREVELLARHSGYISEIDAEKLGVASMLLGGGRAKKTDIIDYGVGIVLAYLVGLLIGDEMISGILFIGFILGAIPIMIFYHHWLKKKYVK